MRMVKFQREMILSLDHKLVFETEVFVQEEGDPEAAGREAGEFLRRFIDGVIEDATMSE